MLSTKKKSAAPHTAKDIDKVRVAKQKKPKKVKSKGEARKVARSVQDTIPYEHVCGKYIFEVSRLIQRKSGKAMRINPTISLSMTDRDFRSKAYPARAACSVR